MAEAAGIDEPDIELPGQVCIPEDDVQEEERETSPSQRPPGSASSVSSSERDTSPTQRPPGSASSVSSSGSGKRVAVTSLSGSSSSEGENSDLEDQIPASPCSSTSSGPIYVRPPGFKHHGQEVQIFTVKHKPSVKLKKKVRRQPTDYNFVTSAVKKEDICDSRTTIVQQPLQPSTKNSPRGSGVMSKLGITGTKPKARKDPLPMKLRALPQSFWQQPNAVNSASPGSMYAVLPPLCKADQTGPDIAEVRPVTPPSEFEEIKEKDLNASSSSTSSSTSGEKLKSDSNNNNNNKGGAGGGKEMSQDVRKKQPRPPPRIVKVSPANTDLLCKLFDSVEASDKKKKLATMRRGRPKREPNHTHSKHLIGDDPYMVDALPILSLGESSSRQSNAPSSHLAVVSVKSGGRTFTLPSLSVEQNYPAMLSEVVKAL